MIALTKRERFLGAGLAIGVAALTLYAVVIRPASSRIQTLERIIPEKQRELHTLEDRIVEYLALCKGFTDFRAKAASQDPNFKLLPYLERLIEQHGLSCPTIIPDVVQVQPGYSETVVQIELEGVSLKQLVSFLKAIEASEVCAQVASLHISKDTLDENLLKSDIEIHSPQLAHESVAADTDRQR